MTRTLYPPTPNTPAPIVSFKVEIQDVRRDTEGNLRFKLHLAAGDGSQITVTGFRYYPATDELKPPCYRVGKGWQPTVELSGPILAELQGQARRIASK